MRAAIEETNALSGADKWPVCRAVVTSHSRIVRSVLAEANV